MISATPNKTGTSTFTVQVTDANSQVATKPLSITIATSPSITTTSLLNGTQNIAYNATLAASGGTTPYTWSITVGSLPAGFSFKDTATTEIYTLSLPDALPISVQVTDANS